MSIVAETQLSRQGYQSPVLFTDQPRRSGEVNPAWFKFRQLLGLRPAQDGRGVWLNCAIVYRKLPVGSGEYDLQAAVQFDQFAKRTGRCYVRSCSCPDAVRRQEAGAQGAARKCKHMIALEAQVARLTGTPPPISGIPAAVFLPARPKRLRPSLAQRQAEGWSKGTWSPASGFTEDLPEDNPEEQPEDTTEDH